MQTPSSCSRRAVRQSITFLISIVPALAALNPSHKHHSQLAALIKQQRLTDSLDWLEAYAITGETAIFFISLMQQGGAE